MRKLLLLLSALALAGSPLAAQEAGRLKVDLNIPALRIVVSQDGKVVRTYPVAVGKLGHDTPEGHFTISRAEWNPWWRPPQGREWTKDAKVTPPGPNNPMGRVKLFFMPLYYIHGTPDEGSLGSPASHGCVRMLNKDVIELATLVHDNGRATVSSSEIPKILANSRTTRNVGFRDSVDLVIRYDLIDIVEGKAVVYPDIYNRRSLHTESVYQALMRAGYDVGSLHRDDVVAFIAKAKGKKAVYRVGVEEAFGKSVALRSREER
jgi:murein L,D-transpeptidase YcbB/YkuD